MNMNEQKSGIVFRGVGIGSGCTAGPLRFLEQRESGAVASPHKIRTPHEERERLHSAIEKTRKALLLLQEKARSEIGAAEAEIFAIHAMLLTDEDFDTIAGLSSVLEVIVGSLAPSSARIAIAVTFERESILAVSST